MTFPAAVAIGFSCAVGFRLRSGEALQLAGPNGIGNRLLRILPGFCGRFPDMSKPKGVWR
jgi:ABC-type sulfate/molybdate transport systems ATPase subunit